MEVVMPMSARVGKTLLARGVVVPRSKGVWPFDEDIPRSERCRVQLVITPLGTGPGLGRGFHSSLIINKTEYFFSDLGIVKADSMFSHLKLQCEGMSSSVIDLGVLYFDVAAFETTLGRHFLPGSYDLLRKNCNSFSDCAIFFLTGMRLDEKYRQLEGYLSIADKFTFLLYFFGYRSNPNAVGFDLERLIPELAWEREQANHSGRLSF